MTVLNYTTKIAATKTIGEVQDLLVKHGASRIAIDYAEGNATGVTFAIVTAHGPRLFSLPVDVDAMERLLKDYRPSGGMSAAAFHTRAHAERVDPDRSAARGGELGVGHDVEPAEADVGVGGERIAGAVARHRVGAAPADQRVAPGLAGEAPDAG